MGHTVGYKINKFHRSNEQHGNKANSNVSYTWNFLSKQILSIFKTHTKNVWDEGYINYLYCGNHFTII